MEKDERLNVEKKENIVDANYQYYILCKEYYKIRKALEDEWLMNYNFSKSNINLKEYLDLKWKNFNEKS